VDPTADTRSFELARVATQTKRLMLGYCDAIESCEAIPTLSFTPLYNLIVQCAVWSICFDLCLLLLPLRLLLFISRRLTGWPRNLFGAAIYDICARPFRSIWAGEVSAFKLSHVGPLTRLFLYYHAQLRMNALLKRYARLRLVSLVSQEPHANDLKEMNDFDKAVDLFQAITTKSYQFGILAIGGPAVALLSLVIQRALLPILKWAWMGLGFTIPHSLADVQGIASFLVVFVTLTLWIFVSAWMDMRAVLQQKGMMRLERDAFVEAGIRVPTQIPYDLLFCMPFFFPAIIAFIRRRRLAKELAQSN
jgi:hypothetical protein